MTARHTPFALYSPKAQAVPFLFASPHSGHYYPPDLLAQTALSFQELRALEDFAVDRLFSWVPALGGTLLTATYARAYVDLNRHPYAVDPDIFSAPLPTFVQKNLIRQRHGLGTLPTMALSGQRLYRHRLPPETLEARLQAAHIPYHAMLRQLIQHIKARFGVCYLLDCHSMPSSAGRYHRQRSVDIVLGDQFGSTFCGKTLQLLQQALEASGYHVALNIPYAGAYTTQVYAAPMRQQFTLQIEINRALYMDEATLTWRAEAAQQLRQNLKDAFWAVLAAHQQETSLLAAE